MTAPQEPGTRAERKTAEWENKSGDYVLNKHTYKSQYAQMYYARLMELAPLVSQRAQQQWGSIPVVKVLALEHGVEQVAVGTVYKDMKLKPTALKEYTEDITVAQQLAADTFCDDDDGVVLEDETARIKLSGNIDVGCLVTGIIIGLRGVLDEKAGVFVVEDQCFAGLPPQPQRQPSKDKKLLAVASGLCVGDSSVDLPRSMLLIDWMKGLFGDADTCKDVVRLVICGGTQGNLDQLATASAASKQQVFAMEAVQEVDRCATELASALPVDLMPGPGDLSNHALPQQPLHHCLFPGAAPCSSFTCVTNPYRFSVDGVECLGTSGQNVHDIERYSKQRRSVEILAENMLQRHLCPTAPDTLACFPYVDKDPFILRETPHLYFVGNQAEFAEEEVVDGDRTVKVVSVPAFAKTGVVVLINLDTLECSPVTFDASLS